MDVKALLERIRTRFPRVRKIRRERIGDRLHVACPMTRQFLRNAEDCRTCEYNLGEKRRGDVVYQLCGYGLKPARQLPGWVVKLIDLLRRIPWPKPYVPARFQWRRAGNRPLTAIQRRQLERRRRRERQRAIRERARQLRSKARAERARRTG